MKKHCPHTPKSATTREKLFLWFRDNTIILGVISLFWLLLKSGRKPTRIQYPCQKAAAANVSIFLIPFLVRFLRKLYDFSRTFSLQQLARVVFFFTISIGIVFSSIYFKSEYKQANLRKYYHKIKAQGPLGKKTVGLYGAASVFQTIPHAFGITSPHRVVSVHHSGATNWDFQCSYGPCPAYYGDDTFVDQNIVDQMFNRGLQSLTSTNSTNAAWQAILPAYQAGEIVAIKVNFNDSIMGGGISGYGDNDSYVDALAQVVNSVITGLKNRGFLENNIRVFDSSRYIPDRFRALIHYKNIRYYDGYGNGADVQKSTFVSSELSAPINFSKSGYPATTHKISDVLVESDYLINIPIMKRHDGSGITLALKNHLGSINGFTSGDHSMHDYCYLNGSKYTSISNPIVDINLNNNIKDKTVLVIGDALYGGRQSNNIPPQRWRSFNNDSPNMLFFAVDPVAVDSVMFDYLEREGYVDPTSEDIMIVAANEGLGVHERWNNDTDREYSTIDYVEIDMDNIQGPSVPSNPNKNGITPILQLLLKGK